MNLVFTRVAHKQLMKISTKIHDSILQKLVFVVADFGIKELNLDIKKLSNRDGCRLRVGDYRIIYQIDKLKDELVVISVGHRREVYK